MRRISKSEAKRMFTTTDKAVYFCPCKMHPYRPWNQAVPLFGKEYLERAAGYRDNPELWEGSVEETAWSLAYNNWAFYNTSHETGYYAHYYID
jgi:hypothetical protein